MGKSLIWYQATPTVYIQLTTGAMNIVMVPPQGMKVVYGYLIHYYNAIHNMVLPTMSWPLLIIILVFFKSFQYFHGRLIK